ncbi:hypothetical protein [Bacteroides cellulosilyticus]|uniref:hypothetical protein n=1 Tax=Bacteroides cellulosilyticus TaxID=246787 RepID=UPI000E469024|nr:hypothetical protein [Bacteroides cellulosilyticus]RGU22440.1 hypothetical protein DWW88_21295 [Bacteroides cellulosilyticus]
MQNNRDKKHKGPAEERKPDITVNTGNLDEIIARQREREKNLYPVRISATTVIYVTKNKATRQYAEEYKRDKLMRLKYESKEKENTY